MKLILLLLMLFTMPASVFAELHSTNAQFMVTGYDDKPIAPNKPEPSIAEMEQTIEQARIHAQYDEDIRRGEYMAYIGLISMVGLFALMWWFAWGGPRAKKITEIAAGGALLAGLFAFYLAICVLFVWGAIKV